MITESETYNIICIHVHRIYQKSCIFFFIMHIRQSDCETNLFLNENILIKCVY